MSAGEIAPRDVRSAGRSERRAGTRWTPGFPARVELWLPGRAGAEELWSAARVVDLSSGGALVRLAGDPSSESPRELLARILLGAREHRVRARVVRRARLPGDGAELAGDGPGQAGDAIGLALSYLGGSGPPPMLDVRDITVDPSCLIKVPATLAIRRRCLPLCVLDGRIVVACADLEDTSMLRALERAFELPIHLQQADPEALAATIRRHYADSIGAPEQSDDDAVGTCQELLRAAHLRRASDIHVDTERDGGRVRLRVDGQLEDLRVLPETALPELFSRIKVLGGMDIAERRAPQDGRFTFTPARGKEIDVRVATLPTQHGERATLRLLAGRAEAASLDSLGMTPEDGALFARAIARPHGLVLATGPTGCGKTTTLSMALRSIVEQRAVNAIAVQDPIEYDLPGVAQVEIDPARKVTFASALRSILRHDPDVIFIGEIRDGETASIAVKAALTGHLVLASLHTNSAAGAVTRLIDMGVDPYLVSATVRLVVSQRLVRRLCASCRAPRALSAAAASSLGLDRVGDATIFEPMGCIYCLGRGYLGRTGLFEILALDDELAKQVSLRIDEASLASASHARGRPSIVDDAAAKLLAGLTSLHEVLQAVAT